MVIPISDLKQNRIYVQTLVHYPPYANVAVAVVVVRTASEQRHKIQRAYLSKFWSALMVRHKLTTDST